MIFQMISWFLGKGTHDFSTVQPLEHNTLRGGEVTFAWRPIRYRKKCYEGGSAPFCVKSFLRNWTDQTNSMHQCNQRKFSKKMVSIRIRYDFWSQLYKVRPLREVLEALISETVTGIKGINFLRRFEVSLSLVAASEFPILQPQSIAVDTPVGSVAVSPRRAFRGLIWPTWAPLRKSVLPGGHDTYAIGSLWNSSSCLHRLFGRKFLLLDKNVYRHTYWDWLSERFIASVRAFSILEAAFFIPFRRQVWYSALLIVSGSSSHREVSGIALGDERMNAAFRIECLCGALKIISSGLYHYIVSGFKPGL